MYGCESWTVKKAEHRRIDAFELWCWRRLLRVPWAARRSNWSILKEISPEYSLEGMMLMLKCQYFGHLMQRADYWKTPWCWERLRVGGEGDDRGWDGWMVSPTQWTWVWMGSGSWCWTGRPGMLQLMGVSKSRTRLSNSTELKHMINVQLTHRSRNVHTREKILGDHNSAYHWHIHRNLVFSSTVVHPPS